jgi:ribulose-5-phosphate 4-epimerase/fuculose-1-phosphate aldolase
MGHPSLVETDAISPSACGIIKGYGRTFLMSATAVPTEVKVGKTPEPPTFATVAEERLHRKQRLASAFRLFAKFGFSEGVAGHITARDPEKLDHFWVNPFGMHFAHIRASDLVLVNESGAVVEGDKPINEAAFAIHSRLHMARPDVVAAAHAHSLYGKTWASMGRLLDPLTQDACAFYDDHSVFSDYTGVVYDMSEGDRIAEALGHRKAVILQNHGTLTVGRTVDEAAWYFITMERSCQVQLMAEAAGKPISISHEAALVAQKQVGNPRTAWFQYQPLYDLIVREQPDLLN